MRSPQKPEELLNEDETAAPAMVSVADNLLRQLGVWFKLGRNSPAMSCRDAAERRSRLGSSGIPLWDELKTLALSDGSRIGLVHCRADQEFDLDRARDALGFTSIERAAEQDMHALGLGYGLVNPFETWSAASDLEIEQVFDEGVMTRLGVPGTMITNAGDHTWSVEFYADELVHAMPLARLGSIAIKPDWPRPKVLASRASIGLVTGNSPESGMHLWQLTVDAVRTLLGEENRGDVSMPPVDVVSIPEMGMSMELDHRVGPVREAVTAAVTQLCERGAHQVGIACNTTQFFGPELSELCDSYGTRYKSMPDAVDRWLDARGVEKIGLVGIRYVADLGEWSEYARQLSTRRIEVPSERGMERIEEIAYGVKTAGPSRKALGKLLNVLRDEIDSQYVVLALTELSTLLGFQGPRQSDPRNEAKVLVDPLQIFAESLACDYVGVPFPSKVFRVTR